jgi:glycosyltransferase involved in cell wall biosynthesis
MKLTILVPAHNEENQIGNCLDSLMTITIPKDFIVDYVVILDRCTDETKSVAEEHGAYTIEKNFRGDYASPIAETLAYGIQSTESDLVLVCDADIQEIPSNAFVKLYSHLRVPIKRVSSEVKTRSGKWWLDILFWLKDLNKKITPLGTEPRGAFTLFERKAVQEVGGLGKQNRAWETAFDLKIKEHGWKVARIKDVTVTEKRDFTLKRLISHQIESGKSRRQLGVGFWRTLGHSFFRGRIFVLYGYIKQILKEL